MPEEINTAVHSNIITWMEYDTMMMLMMMNLHVLCVSVCNLTLNIDSCVVTVCCTSVYCASKYVCVHMFCTLTVLNLN